MTDKNKIFSELYAGELFGRAVDAYAKAYDIDLEKRPDRRGSVSASATRLLKDVNVLQYINKLRGDFHLVRELVDSKLGFLIMQEADLSTSLNAIKHFDSKDSKIDSKVSDNKVTIEIVTNDKGIRTETEAKKEATESSEEQDTGKGSTKKK